MIGYIVGPVIGAIIGYCTNYIAVKMLFYPRKEVKLWGRRLPFTPGVIPKGKDRLAGAIGDIVGSRLITQEDLEDKILGADTASMIAGKLDMQLKDSLKEQLIVLAGYSEDEYQTKKEAVADSITTAAAEAVQDMEISEFLMNNGVQTIMETLNNPMLAMFLSPELLQSVLGPVGDRLKVAAFEEKDELIRPAVINKLSQLEDASPDQLLAGLDINISEIVSGVAMNLMKDSLGQVLEAIDIQQIVREKVDAMTVEEVEDMVLTVMRKELNAIVNLGALIGLIIGSLTIIF